MSFWSHHPERSSTDAPATTREAKKRFSPEERLAAVQRLVVGRERPAAIAAELGVHRNTVRRWKRQLAGQLAQLPTEPTILVTEEAIADAEEAIAEASEAIAEAEELIDETAAVDAEPTGGWDPAELNGSLRGEIEAPDWQAVLPAALLHQQSRIARLVRSLDVATLPENREAALESLTAQATADLAIVHDTQNAIDRMIHANQMTTARTLSGFRTDFRQGLNETLERIGSDATREAHQRARALRTAPTGNNEVLRTVDEEQQADAPRRRRASVETRREAPSVATSRSSRSSRRPAAGLVLVMAAAVLVWLGLSVVGRPEPIPMLGTSDFSHLEGIESIRADPPHLFVVVNADRWRTRSLGQRRHWIGQFAIVAETAGYRGAHFTTGDGDPVGGWGTDEGVRLLEQPDLDFAYRYKVGDPV